MYLKIKTFFINIKNLLEENLKLSKKLLDNSSLKNEVLQNRILLGKVLSNINLNRRDEFLNDIQKSEFKIFSQWGDDGIINFLINYLDIEEKSFIEFGVENYTECNTRFLLINDNWSGLIIDGSESNIDSVRKDDIYWRYDLTAISSFITAENINQIISENGFAGDLGILHIDIDGNDYWIWKEITSVNPTVVIVEYNSIFGYDKPYTTPYKSDFVRSEAHYSNLYYGSSLLSLCDLADEKGYSFVGCNSNGNNAYFVRKDKTKDLRALSVEEGYVESKFSESRDKNNNLTFIKGAKRLESLQGKEIYNTRKSILEKL